MRIPGRERQHQHDELPLRDHRMLSQCIAGIAMWTGCNLKEKRKLSRESMGKNVPGKGINKSFIFK